MQKEPTLKKTLCQRLVLTSRIGHAVNLVRFSVNKFRQSCLGCAQVFL